MSINYKSEDEIDLKPILKLVWKKKLIISLFVLAFGFLTSIYSLTLPNIYKSYALISPLNQNLQSQQPQFPNNFGIGSFIGLSLPTANLSKSEEATEILKSFRFFEEFLNKEDVLRDLMAFTAWDEKSNTSTFNSSIYDVDSESWKINNSTKESLRPSSQTAFLKFKSIFSVKKNPENNLLNIGIEHQSPYIAKKWVDEIVELINEIVRREDKIRASNSINFLKKQIVATDSPEIKAAISNLIQQETKTIMLTEAGQDYVYKLLEPPIVSEKKYKPSRFIYLAAGMMIGLIIGVIYSLIPLLAAARKF